MTPAKYAQARAIRKAWGKELSKNRREDGGASSEAVSQVLANIDAEVAPILKSTTDEMFDVLEELRPTIDDAVKFCKPLKKDPRRISKLDYDAEFGIDPVTGKSVSEPDHLDYLNFVAVQPFKGWFDSLRVRLERLARLQVQHALNYHAYYRTDVVRAIDYDGKRTIAKTLNALLGRCASAICHPISNQPCTVLAIATGRLGMYVLSSSYDGSRSLAANHLFEYMPIQLRPVVFDDREVARWEKEKAADQPASETEADE